MPATKTQYVTQQEFIWRRTRKVSILIKPPEARRAGGGDAVTREKAQKVLEDITVDHENRAPDEIAELDEALDMAITALKTQEDDNISIHTVIDAINGMPTFVDRNGEKLIHQGLTKIKIKALASTTGHTDESSLVKSDANDEDRTEDDQISRRAAIHTVQKIILGFFSDADGVMTDTEKTLLSVNKAICNALRAQGNEKLDNNSPKVDSDSGDLISRQAAIEVLGVFTQTDVLGHTPKQIVEALPSAQPETHERRTETHSCDGIERQAAIDEEASKLFNSYMAIV